MSIIYTPGSGSSISSDECTAKLGDIPAGLKAITADSNDEVGVGTMPDHGSWSSGELAAGVSVTIPAGRHSGSGKVTAKSLATQTAATATAAQIRSGYSAWVNGQLIWGTLNIQSAINFSAAAVSYNQIKIVWQNPSIGPWEGVFIQMSTGGYPGSSGGTRVYTGVGSNAAAGGWSEVIVSGLAMHTSYYFTCTSYVNAMGWGNSYNVSAGTSSRFNISGLPVEASYYGDNSARTPFFTIPSGASKLVINATGKTFGSGQTAGWVGLTKTTSGTGFSYMNNKLFHNEIFGGKGSGQTQNTTIGINDIGGFNVCLMTAYTYNWEDGFVRINSAYIE